MPPLQAGQIKAARAILDWSQEDLAQIAGLSTATIRNLEMGSIPRGSTMNVVRQAIEEAGLEFIEPEGVRRRVDEVRILQGADSALLLREDMESAARRAGGLVGAVLPSQEMLAKALGLEATAAREFFDRLAAFAEVKAIFSEWSPGTVVIDGFAARMAGKGSSVPVPYILYGDRHALVMAEARGQFKFVIFRAHGLAQSYRAHFRTLWDLAIPVTPQGAARCHAAAR